MEDHKILVYLLKNYEGKVPWEGLAQELGCSVNAMSKRIHKIRKSVPENDPTGSLVADDKEVEPKTVQKRKRSAKAEGKSKGNDKKVKVTKPSDEEVQAALVDEEQE